MRKKVVLISHELSYTGAPRSLLNVALALRKAKFDVTVWSLIEGEFREEFEKRKFPVSVINGCMEDLGKRAEEFDLAICNTFFGGECVKYLQSYIPTIFYIREAENLPDLAKNCCLDEENLKNAEHVVCVSEYAKHFIEKQYEPKEIQIVHNCVVDEYRGRRNRLKKDMIHIMIAGTVEHRKGQDIAIEAFRKLPNEIRNHMMLHIVGRKPEWSREYWEQLEFSEESHVIYHPEVRDKKERRRLYEGMNVFLVASRDESCSLVALEGAMFGKALILTENVGAKYLLTPENGFSYETESSEQLKVVLENLYKRKSELKRMGKVSRKQYLRMATPKVNKSELLKAIELVLERK
ncbi:MAG: glycosyltransferase family 4 protein [bacterium]|nr:glycosyltransferase family 4 protein [bacterium]